MILEYLPLKSLEYQHKRQPISEDETLAVLHQGLLALTYLHRQTPPIMHRDIKPANILVQSRIPFHIKLADFGLSKASDYLATLCGSLIYAAPEVVIYVRSQSARCVKYSKAVDIWSLGVVIFQYTCGLPDDDGLEGLAWCKKIVMELNDWDSDCLIDILSTMIVMEPDLRDSAEICLHKTLEMPDLGRFLKSTSAFYEHQQPQRGEVYQQGAVAYSAEGRRDSWQEDSNDLFRESEIQRYIKSKVSLHSGPPTFTERRKRFTQLSTAFSESFGRPKILLEDLPHEPNDVNSGNDAGLTNQSASRTEVTNNADARQREMAALLQEFIGERCPEINNPTRRKFTPFHPRVRDPKVRL